MTIMPKKKTSQKRKKIKSRNFEKKADKFLIIGGHMTPALAVADELIERGYENILWVGHKKSQTGDKNTSAEYREVNRRGIKFQSLITGKFWRKWTLATIDKALINLIKIPIGFIHAGFLLLTFRPRTIISFGGYLSVPIILNWLPNRLNKTNIYIHSQTIKPDLSVKLTNRFAKKVFLTWSVSRNHYKHKNTKVVGTPLNKAILNPPTDESERAFKNDLPILLILGGNQGANTFNRRLGLPILENYLKEMNMVHQTGSSTITKDYENALSNRKRLDDELKSRYKIFPYILPENLNALYPQTTLILSRSGANTVQEIMFKGVPSVLMPIPWSQNNEQLENAKIAASTGLAKIFEFKEGLKEEKLLEEIKSALDQTTKRESFKPGVSWSKAKKQAHSKIKLNSSKTIANEIL
ncbi:hypothetical protein GF389_04975 [Candidatus Dojkabacteria bacterium]|nr:hypothetical protein [Candidatus Dojkabacteria bacterium]